jgi:hypothetical protein
MVRFKGLQNMSTYIFVIILIVAALWIAGLVLMQISDNRIDKYYEEQRKDLHEKLKKIFDINIDGFIVSVKIILNNINGE